MSLEFSHRSLEQAVSDSSRVLEETGRMLDELTEGLLLRNNASIELESARQLLSGHLESSRAMELLSHDSGSSEILAKLEKISKKCQSAKNIGEITALRQEYEKLTGAITAQRYQTAITQTGINARAGLAAEGIISNAPKIIDTAVPAISPVNAAKAAAEHQQQIVNEALRRTKAEEAARATSEKAQKYYASISDVTTGKSAKESAGIIDEALKIKEEAIKRMQAEEAAKAAVHQQQIVNEAIKRTQAEEAAKVTAEKAQKYYASISDVTTGKSAKESAEFFEESFKNQPLSEKIKTFIKEKALPFTKTKQFKFILAGIAAVLVGLGIIIHNKNKNTEKNKINTVK